jgi:hypothetical protein
MQIIGHSNLKTSQLRKHSINNVDYYILLYYLKAWQVNSLYNMLKNDKDKFVKSENCETNNLIFNLVNLIFDLSFPPMRLI